MSNKKVRHVLGLSGGKDSTALALYLKDKVADMEYFFCDTHKELPETYEFLARLELRLGKKINILCDERGFDHWLQVYGGYLPSPKARWCTKQLKIIPLEKFIGEDEAVSYIAIRADEDRVGYISTKVNIKPVFPFMKNGLVKRDIIRILDENGVGMPQYYSWRSRSGCYFCFFQRKIEWVRLSEIHPDLFSSAVRYEQEHEDGRRFSWNQDESLLQLLSRKEKIIEEFHKTALRKEKMEVNKPLVEVFSVGIDEEDAGDICTFCHL